MRISFGKLYEPMLSESFHVRCALHTGADWCPVVRLFYVPPADTTGYTMFVSKRCLYNRRGVIRKEAVLLKSSSCLAVRDRRLLSIASNAYLYVNTACTILLLHF